MNIIEATHQRADRVAAREIARSEFKPCCRVGCSACCYEPAYAIRAEIEHALKLLTPEQLEMVKAKTKVWVKKAEASGLLNGELADATQWRLNAIACPFLEGALCSIYARRPIGCRVFFAKGDPADCDMPMRQHQLYASFANHIMDEICRPLLESEEVDCRDADHIGVLLAEIFAKENK